MENKKALGIGVVGCGSTGIQSVLQHTCEEDKGDLVYTAAVMDPVPGRAQYCAEKFGVAKYYTDYDELLKDPDVDLVTLASPIKVHFEQGMKAIRAGKHVHFNKTMTISTAEATQLIEEAEKYGVKIVSSPGQMTAPALRRVRKAVLTGEIGIPSWTIGGSEGVLLWHCQQANREMGEGMPKIDPSWYFKKPDGGPVWDCTVYALHAMTGIFGPVKRVTCMCGQRYHDFEFDGKKIKKGEIMALENGKIVSTSTDITKATYRLARGMCKKDSSFVTIISGCDVSDEDAEKVTEMVKAKCPNHVEVSHIRGGQPVYYYMISVE